MKSEIKLIDGIFTAKEAREVIGKLLDFKIQFHSKENFSHEIRQGNKNERSERRKEELLAAHADFLKTISTLDPEIELEIHANITLAEK